MSKISKRFCSLRSDPLGDEADNSKAVARGHSGADDVNTFDDMDAWAVPYETISVDGAELKMEQGAGYVALSFSAGGVLSSLTGGFGVGAGGAAKLGASAKASASLSGAISAAAGAITGALW
jgi:hypothetical protein